MKMNTFDEIEESIVETSFGRWRRRNKGNWKREVGKRCRSSGGDKIPGISCHHNSTNCRALMLTFDDLANISKIGLASPKSFLIPVPCTLTFHGQRRFLNVLIQELVM